MFPHQNESKTDAPAFPNVPSVNAPILMKCVRSHPSIWKRSRNATTADEERRLRSHVSMLVMNVQKLYGIDLASRDGMLDYMTQHRDLLFDTQLVFNSGNPQPRTVICVPGIQVMTAGIRLDCESVHKEHVSFRPPPHSIHFHGSVCLSPSQTRQCSLVPKPRNIFAINEASRVALPPNMAKSPGSRMYSLPSTPYSPGNASLNLTTSNTNTNSLERPRVSVARSSVSSFAGIMNKKKNIGFTKKQITRKKNKKKKPKRHSTQSLDVDTPTKPLKLQMARSSSDPRLLDAQPTRRLSPINESPGDISRSTPSRQNFTEEYYDDEDEDDSKLEQPRRRRFPVPLALTLAQPSRRIPKRYGDSFSSEEGTAKISRSGSDSSVLSNHLSPAQNQGGLRIVLNNSLDDGYESTNRRPRIEPLNTTFIPPLSAVVIPGLSNTSTPAVSPIRQQPMDRLKQMQMSFNASVSRRSSTSSMGTFGAAVSPGFSGGMNLSPMSIRYGKFGDGADTFPEAFGILQEQENERRTWQPLQKSTTEDASKPQFVGEYISAHLEDENDEIEGMVFLDPIDDLYVAVEKIQEEKKKSILSLNRGSQRLLSLLPEENDSPKSDRIETLTPIEISPPPALLKSRSNSPGTLGVYGSGRNSPLSDTLSQVSMSGPMSISSRSSSGKFSTPMSRQSQPQENAEPATEEAKDEEVPVLDDEKKASLHGLPNIKVDHLHYEPDLDLFTPTPTEDNPTVSLQLFPNKAFRRKKRKSGMSSSSQCSCCCHMNVIPKQRGLDSFLLTYMCESALISPVSESSAFKFSLSDTQSEPPLLSDDEDDYPFFSMHLADSDDESEAPPMFRKKTEMYVPEDADDGELYIRSSRLRQPVGSARKSHMDDILDEVLAKGQSPPPVERLSVYRWSTSEVVQWILSRDDVRLHQYANIFHAKQVWGSQLIQMNMRSLKKEYGITNTSECQSLYDEIQKLVP